VDASSSNEGEGGFVEEENLQDYERMIKKRKLRAGRRKPCMVSLSNKQQM